MSTELPEAKDDAWVDPHPPKKRWPRWLGTFALVLMVYILSAGPMVWLVNRSLMPVRLFNTIYRPLTKVGRFCPPFKYAFHWYVQLWSSSPVGYGANHIILDRHLPSAICLASTSTTSTGNGLP